MKKVLLIAFCFSILKLNAQVEIKVMQYNLLYYGLNVYECNSSNNGINNKTNYLKTIINSEKPDIFCVNEIHANNDTQNYLLWNVFTNSGYSSFARATTTGPSNFAGNQVYYDAHKFYLYAQSSVYANPAQFDIYRFYYRSPDLLNGDTVKLTCIVGHLKAGNTPDDEATRAVATQNLMSTLEAYYPVGNYLLMGDFNLYSSSEQSYQNLINYTNSDYKFKDPINSAGSWNSNSNYENIHTQSTHYSNASNPCPSSGGMDDRFDFILCSNSLMNQSNKIHYVTYSYKTVGNDGNHYNNSINDGTNNSVSASVLDALYNNSDHLPVSLKLSINQNPVDIEPITQKYLDIKIQNPVKEYLNVTIYVNDVFNSDNFNVEIYNLLGQKVYQNSIEKQINEINYQIPVLDLNSGLYILRIYDNQNNFYQDKFIKLN